MAAPSGPKYSHRSYNLESILLTTRTIKRQLTLRDAGFQLAKRLKDAEDTAGSFQELLIHLGSLRESFADVAA